DLPHVTLGGLAVPGAGLLERWLEPVTRAGDELLARGAGGEAHLSNATELVLLAFGAGLALFFAHRGYRAYVHGPARDEALRRGQPELARFLEGAWQIDRAYERRVVLPLRAGAEALSSGIDKRGIDAAVDGLGRLANALGTRMRALADGQ